MFTLDELRRLHPAAPPDLAEKIGHLIELAGFKGTVYVDVPNPEQVGVDDGSWISLKTFKSMPDAVAWVRDNVGDCDEWGHVSLATYGDPASDDDTGEFDVPGFIP